jgi:hypothetical protein
VQGHTIVPRSFIMDLAHTQKETLKEFMVNMTELTLEGVKYLCTTFLYLEHLACSVASPNVVCVRLGFIPNKSIDICVCTVVGRDHTGDCERSKSSFA